MSKLRFYILNHRSEKQINTSEGIRRNVSFFASLEIIIAFLSRSLFLSSDDEECGTAVDNDYFDGRKVQMNS